MNCEHESASPDRRFYERFYPKVLKDRIPLEGSIELTGRCNLNCIHCYGRSSKRPGTDDQAELSGLQWMNLIDQITEAGCLFLLLTGGEALLRPDFYDIYRHACRSGLLVTVFTNATLIDDQTFKAFEMYPPQAVEISLYGATANTYEAVTGVAGSFEKCMRGIHGLKDRGFRIKLKTMALTANFHELEHIEAIAAGLGAHFRFDALVFPRLDGNPAPVSYRVGAREAVEKEFANRDRARQLHDLYYRLNSRKPSSDLYQCGAGLNMFNISPCGVLQPCLMVSGQDNTLLNSSFNEIWHSSQFLHFRKKGTAAPEKCRDCVDKTICGYCPGFFHLESGSEQVYSDFLCRMGQERKRAILNFHVEEASA